MNKKSDDQIIIVQQRLHEDDMIGHVNDIGGFELLSFPAIAQEDEEHIIRTTFGSIPHSRKAGEALHPERESHAVLGKQRILLGDEQYAAQYLQSPTPPGGGIVKIAWFNRYDLANKPPFERVLQSWDCASKASQLADHSVCTTWGVTRDKRIYLLHVFRGRLEYPELKRKVRELAESHRAGTVLIEDTASGIQLIQELQREGFARITAVKPKGAKIMRMAAQTPTIEVGRVWIPREAPWLAIYLHELAMFPKGKHDDQVDSTAQALACIAFPSDFDEWLNYVRIRSLSEFGLTPEDLVITFDHIDARTEFQDSNGRNIWRETDGFYHATRAEWESICAIPGVTLINSGEC
ncbi:phage terminase large subunit [Aquisediminimonas profunda]|uniref:phage terminase large subunit n=1 Tax=Aquisediminimonas profunda TaxID=1550733 RepID=UPI001C63A954|nr:phage terminase large subunit [Aquisediminimonas profunda]